MDVDTSEYYCRMSLELAQDQKNEDRIAQSNTMLAILYDIRGNMEKATDLFLKAAMFYKQQGNNKELSKTYNNLGVMFYNSGDTDKAWEYNEKSLIIDTSLGDSLGVAASMINLATIMNSQAKFDQSYGYISRGREIVKSLDEDNWVRKEIFQILGNYHLNIENYDCSLFYFEMMLPIYRRATDLNQLISCLISMTVARSHMGNYDEAAISLAEAEQLTEQYEDVTQKKKLFRIGAELFAASGNFKRAYGYQQKYQEANDSVTSHVRIRALTDMEEKYQSELKEMEIVNLEIGQEQSENQRNISILIAVFVLGFCAFLFILLRQKSRAGFVISKSLAEKETLLKEIHHRVKNNLQVVSSLLSMQSRFIKDEGALDAVKEGQARVESMALIHQKLYQENNLSGVSAKEYVEDLAEVLRNSYGMEDKVDLTYEIDNLVIDVDTIIPIGLILNELISNSFKHAFPNGNEGDLVVGLKEIDEELILTVKDDGVGSSGETTEKSFGMVLINSLAMKLKATLEMNYDSGALAKLSIKKYKLV